MIPHIPRVGPPTTTAATPAEGGFTVRDGLAWLNIPWDTYEAGCELTRGRHGGPFVSALMDARAAQGTATTPAAVLAKHGIDPADPLAAVRAWVTHRSAFDA